MLGDVAYARDDHHPGQKRHQPQKRIGPPDTSQRERRKQHSICGELWSQLLAKMTHPPKDRPGRITERVEELRPSLLIGGATSDVAPELATKARLGNWERCREHQIRVRLLLRVG